MDEPYEEDYEQRQVVTYTSEVERPKVTSLFFVEPKVEPKTPQEKLLAAAIRANQNAFYRQIDEIRVVEQTVDTLQLEFKKTVSEVEFDDDDDKEIIISSTPSTKKIASTGKDPLIEALKHGIIREYEFLFSTLQKEISGLLALPILIILGIKYTTYSDDLTEDQKQQKIKEDTVPFLKDLQRILGLPSLMNDDGPEKFTVASLRKAMGDLSVLSAEAFLTKLVEHNWLTQEIVDSDQFLLQTAIAGITNSFLAFRNQIVASYQRYFQLADEHLALAKRCGVNLTEQDVDVIRCAVYEKIKASPGDFVSAFVQELMKAYAQPEYTEVRDSLFLLILNEANAGENSTNQLLGHNQPINLQEQAEKTLQLESQQVQEPQKQLEGSHTAQYLLEENSEEVRQESKEIVLVGDSGDKTLVIASSVSEEVVATCQLFAHVGEVKDIFRGLSCEAAYTGTKQPAIDAARGYINTHREDTNLEQLNAFYSTAKAYINRHKNPIRDAIFGIVNTASWQIVAKEIRVLAFQALQNKLSQIEGDQEKIAFLETARDLAIFREHRHNYVITGAWGRTDTVAEIDKLIESIKPSQAMRFCTIL